jgi:hypothetical protein
MHVFLELVAQFEYLYNKTIIMDIAISFRNGEDPNFSKHRYKKEQLLNEK